MNEGLIRYRVFDGKKMWYPEDFDNPTKHFLVGMDGSVWTQCVLPKWWQELIILDAIAMLSTGLHDKHGREIYAGDVLRCRMGTGLFDVLTVSSFSNGACRLTRGNFSEPLAASHADRYEVIGNVHEH